MKKIRVVWKELKKHIPFTALATVIAVLVVGFFPVCWTPLTERMFGIVHPAHIAFSAFVTSAIYYKYKK